jgi:hypothetical protein
LIRPLAARAQQTPPVIGILHEGLPAPLSLTAGFQQGLIEGGINQGSSVKIENLGQKVNTIDYRRWRRT